MMWEFDAEMHDDGLRVVVPAPFVCEGVLNDLGVKPEDVDSVHIYRYKPCCACFRMKVIPVWTGDGVRVEIKIKGFKGRRDADDNTAHWLLDNLLTNKKGSILGPQKIWVAFV